MDLPLRGACRCTALRFEITAPPIVSVACHCRGCQKMTGGPYSLSLAVAPQGFRVTAGDEVGGGVDPGFGHRFCARCLTWSFTRLDALGLVNVRITLLDDPGPWPPFAETCTADRLAWVTTPARHSFPAFPAADAWPALAAEFAAEASPLRPR